MQRRDLEQPRQVARRDNGNDTDRDCDNYVRQRNGHRARRAVDHYGLLPQRHVEQRQRRQRLAPEEIERSREQQERDKADELPRLLADRGDIDLGLLELDRLDSHLRRLRSAPLAARELLAALERAPDLETPARDQNLAHGDAVHEERAADDGDRQHQTVLDLSRAVIVAPQSQAGDRERHEREHGVPDDARRPERVAGRKPFGEDPVFWIRHPGEKESRDQTAGEEGKSSEPVAEVLRAADGDHREDEGRRSQCVFQPVDILPEHGAGTLRPAESAPRTVRSRCRRTARNEGT